MTTNSHDLSETAIASRALLVWLTITGWTARRYDRKVTADINAQYAATSDAGRYNKSLLPGDHPAYKAIVSLQSSIRAQHYTQTLPWTDEGWRILPIASYDAYGKWYRDISDAHERAVSDLLSDYASMRASASRLLGKMYREEDYPSIDDLEKRFRLTKSIKPVPLSSDVRVSLADDQLADIRASIEADTRSATETAMRECWNRLHDVTAHMVERLSSKDAIFRDTLVTNARECCDALRTLNLTGDPALERMRRRVESELASYDPEELRRNDYRRADVARKAAAIVDQMSQYFTPEVGHAA